MCWEPGDILISSSQSANRNHRLADFLLHFGRTKVRRNSPAVQYTICLAADTLALYVYIFVDGFLQTVWKVWQTITLQNKIALIKQWKLLWLKMFEGLNIIANCMVATSQSVVTSLTSQLDKAKNGTVWRLPLHGSKCKTQGKGQRISRSPKANLIRYFAALSAAVCLCG